MVNVSLLAFDIVDRWMLLLCGLRRHNEFCVTMYNEKTLKTQTKPSSIAFLERAVTEDSVWHPATPTTPATLPQSHAVIPYPNQPTPTTPATLATLSHYHAVIPYLDHGLASGHFL